MFCCLPFVRRYLCATNIFKTCVLTKEDTQDTEVVAVVVGLLVGVDIADVAVTTCHGAMDAVTPSAVMVMSLPVCTVLPIVAIATRITVL